MIPKFMIEEEVETLNGKRSYIMDIENNASEFIYRIKDGYFSVRVREWGLRKVIIPAQ
jgi:hypothetical protein